MSVPGRRTDASGVVTDFTYEPKGNLASMAQSTIVCHLANAALLAGETVYWDKTKNDIVGRAGRYTQSYYREYRKPWKLEV